MDFLTLEKISIEVTNILASERFVKAERLSYGTVGADDLIVVSIPPGHYRAVFQLKVAVLRCSAQLPSKTDVPYQTV